MVLILQLKVSLLETTVVAFDLALAINAIAAAMIKKRLRRLFGIMAGGGDFKARRKEMLQKE